MTKTYKIGEYAVGGIITITFENNEFIVQFKDWNTKNILLEKRTTDKFEAEMFISDNCTSYYADMIINFKDVKEKV